MEEFKWAELPKREEPPISDRDLRIVDLPVKVVFRWSEKIIEDCDDETGEVIAYTSGYIMEVVPDQSFIYRNQSSVYLGSVLPEQKKK